MSEALYLTVQGNEDTVLSTSFVVARASRRVPMCALHTVQLSSDPTLLAWPTELAVRTSTATPTWCSSLARDSLQQDTETAPFDYFPDILFSCTRRAVPRRAQNTPVRTLALSFIRCLAVLLDLQTTDQETGMSDSPGHHGMTHSGVQTKVRFLIARSQKYGIAVRLRCLLSQCHLYLRWNPQGCVLITPKRPRAP